MSAPNSSFYVTGGTLRPDALSYVERRADQELYDGLKRGEFCYALTSRQMGKSSLMVRTVQRLRQEGVAVAVLDLTAVGQNLSVEQWYDGLMSLLGQQLNLEDELLEFWRNNERWGPLQRSMAALEKVVLPQVRNRAEAAQRQKSEIRNQKSEINLVIFVDEIDVVRSLPFSTDEFFAAIRECYNRRSRDAEFNRLAFCLLGVATPTDLIRETRMTPFNVGLRIELNDFTEAEAAPLAKGLSADEQLAPRLLQRVLHWTSGHPYLTQRLCRAVAENAQASGPADVDRLCEELFLSSRARERDDNLIFVRERLLHSEADLAAMLTLYAQVHKGKRAADDEANPLVSMLRLSGVTKSVDGQLRVRNRIYERVFDRDWITANMPVAEFRRQRAAFRRGVVRTTVAGALVVVLIFWLAALALRPQSLNLRQTLPDGTILTLQQVTFGKQHWFRSIGFQWPWPIPIIRTWGGTETPNEGLAVWLTRRDPATGKYLSVNVGVSKPVDEHGCIFGYNGGGAHFDSGTSSVQAITLSSFPRRQKEFKLVLYDRGGKHLADVNVPIPKAARGSFENLMPELLPVTKRDGELSFTLANLTAQSSQGSINQVPMEGFYFVPEFRITDNGQPTDEWSAENIIASDATGNLTEGNARFCLYEPALKFRVKFFRNERAHFTTSETWTLRNVAIPREGAITPLDALPMVGRPLGRPQLIRDGALTRLDGVPVVKGVWIDMLAMGGAGTVTYNNVVVPGSPFGTSADYGTGSWSGFFEGGEYHVEATRSAAGAPAVVTVKAAVPHLRTRLSGLGEDQRVTVIATDEQGRPVKLAREVGGGLDNMWCWFMKLPPGAKTIDVTFAFHRCRTVEFTVRPPLPPKQPDPK